VNRARELSFRWALADSAAEYMRPDARARLCAKIGAGKRKSALADLLALFAHRRRRAAEQTAPIRAWIQRYAATDRKAVLLRV
jgi:hypothetical protein